MLKVIENKRADIEETLKNAKLTNKAVTKPTDSPKTDPQTEKSKIIEIDPKSQMNPLALINQLFNPEITIEEVKFGTNFVVYHSTLIRYLICLMQYRGP